MTFRSITTASVAVALLFGSGASAAPPPPDIDDLMALCEMLLQDHTDLCRRDYCIWDGYVRIVCVPGDLPLAELLSGGGGS